MTYESNTGLGVNNHYGPRTTGFSVGVEQATDSTVRMSITLTGESLNSSFLPPVYFLKGYLFKEAVLRVDEAFALGGTTPAVSVGVSGSIGTNYITLSETELENVGTKVPTSTGAGTLAFDSATGVTANAAVAIALTGTDPTADSTVGKATLILEFTNKAKA